MIGNWRQLRTPLHKRFFDFAEAYRQSALDCCNRIIGSDHEKTWPNANVALMLSAHSIELFLKGAILMRARDYRFEGGHSLERLTELFDEQYEKDGVSFALPFRTENLVVNEDSLVKAEEPSIRYRYPVDRKGEEWTGIEAFEAAEFVEILEYLGDFYSDVAAL